MTWLEGISTLVVVEPHADDAFVSCHAHMETALQCGVKVLIVTVFANTRKRAVDAASYAKHRGANWYGMPFVEDFPLPDAATLLEMTGPNLALAEYGVKMILPVAITHEDHFAVRRLFEEAHRGRFWYYLDQPYAGITKNSDATQRAIAGMRIVSYIKPDYKKYRFIPLFKDQAKFFYYNPAEKLKFNPEILLEGAE